MTPVEAILWSALQLAASPPTTAEPPRTCVKCGCTDDHACVVDGVPCHWVAEDLCSACAKGGL